MTSTTQTPLNSLYPFRTFPSLFQSRIASQGISRNVGTGTNNGPSGIASQATADLTGRDQFSYDLTGSFVNDPKRTFEDATSKALKGVDTKAWVWATTIGDHSTTINVAPIDVYLASKSEVKCIPIGEIFVEWCNEVGRGLVHPPRLLGVDVSSGVPEQPLGMYLPTSAEYGASNRLVNLKTKVKGMVRPGDFLVSVESGIYMGTEEGNKGRLVDRACAIVEQYVDETTSRMAVAHGRETCIPPEAVEAMKTHGKKETLEGLEDFLAEEGKCLVATNHPYLPKSNMKAEDVTVGIWSTCMYHEKYPNHQNWQEACGGLNRKVSLKLLLRKALRMGGFSLVPTANCLMDSTGR